MRPKVSFIFGNDRFLCRLRGGDIGNKKHSLCQIWFGKPTEASTEPQTGSVSNNLPGVKLSCQEGVSKNIL